MKNFLRKTLIIFMLFSLIANNVFCHDDDNYSKPNKPKLYYCEGKPAHVHVNEVCPYKVAKEVEKEIKTKVETNKNKYNNTKQNILNTVNNFNIPKVNFSIPPTKIDLDDFLKKHNAIDNRIELNIGEKIFLSAVVEPSKKINENVIWESRDYTVASIEGNNLIANTPGYTIITASTYNGLKKFFEVKVLPIEAESIEIDQKGIKLVKGDTVKLTATILPVNTTDKNVIWHSSNEQIASIKDGVITAHKTGKVIITAATANGKTSRMNVQIKLNTVLITLYSFMAFLILFIVLGSIYVYKSITNTLNKNKNKIKNLKNKINIKSKQKEMQKKIIKNIEYNKNNKNNKNIKKKKRAN